MHLTGKHDVTIQNGTFLLPALPTGRNSAVLLVEKCTGVRLGSDLVLSGPDCTITNFEIHGEIAAQGALGTLTITNNRISHMAGKLPGNLPSTDPSAHLNYTDNVAINPKGDGSSLGVNVMGWVRADVSRNTQPYATTKKNYAHSVKARNVGELRVDDNILYGLEGHCRVLERGAGLGVVTTDRDVTT